MFVKPADGLKIRDPYKRDHLPAEGRDVVDDLYWKRMIRDGDVEEIDPLPEAAPSPAAPPAPPQSRASASNPPIPPAPAAKSVDGTDASDRSTPQ